MENKIKKIERTQKMEHIEGKRRPKVKVTHVIENNKTDVEFDWGNDSEGAFQLAYSILCAFVDEDFAEEFYKDFEKYFVSKIKTDTWKLTYDEAMDIIDLIIVDDCNKSFPY